MGSTRYTDSLEKEKLIITLLLRLMESRSVRNGQLILGVHSRGLHDAIGNTIKQYRIRREKSNER